MSLRSHTQVLLLAVLGGLVLSGVGVYHLRKPVFEGHLFVPIRNKESLVVAPHDGYQDSSLDLQALAPQDLPFENGTTGRRLSSAQRYDAVRLPFSVRFDSVEITKRRPDGYAVVYHRRDGEELQEVSVGATLILGDETCTIEAIGLWEGLIRHSGGKPMATVTLDRANGETLLFLDEGAWAYPDAKVAILFQWHGNESEAREQANTWAMAEGAARWGVKDGSSIQWMQNFVPGGTVKTGAGRVVTLVHRSADHRQIELKALSGHATEAFQIEVNKPPGDHGLIYENPALVPQLVVLHAWRDGVGLVQWRGPGVELMTARLEEGTWWSGDGATRIRLDQVMGESLPLTRSDGHIEALHLHQGGRRVVLREGLITTIDGTRVEFRRTPRPPRAHYSFRILDDAGEVTKSVFVGDQTGWRYGRWTFQNDSEALFSEDHVVLSAHRYRWPW